MFDNFATRLAEEFGREKAGGAVSGIHEHFQRLCEFRTADKVIDVRVFHVTFPHRAFAACEIFFFNECVQVTEIGGAERT